MEKPRRKFKLALSEKGRGITLGENWGRCEHNRALDGFAEIPDVTDLAKLVIQCRMHPELVGEFSRFVTAIIDRRKRLFRYWLARGSSYFPTPNLNV